MGKMLVKLKIGINYSKILKKSKFYADKDIYNAASINYKK